MKPQLILLACGVGGGLALGWLSAPIPAPAGRSSLETPAVQHAGREAAIARARLAALGLTPPPVIDAEPPPPDIAVLFRRDLTAIEDRAAGPVVWIIDFTQTHQRRALRIGDVYQDGWRVARISPQSVELRRRREVRAVNTFALPVIEP